MLNWVNYPFMVDWKSSGQRFGFRGGGLATVYIPTADGMTIGAWHILPRRAGPIGSAYSHREALDFSKLAKAERVYLYFHGNAGNRAMGTRPAFYRMLTRYPGSHVLAIDYRGFGDSSSMVPTEISMAEDAMAAYEWLIDHKVPASRIVITGHSLGSGVATQLAYSLSKYSGGRDAFGGLLLLSGYASIGDAALGYTPIPLLRPFLGNPDAEKWIKNQTLVKFDNVNKVGQITRPILILHGRNDWDVAVWQSQALFLEAATARSKTKWKDEGYWNLRRGAFALDKSIDVQHLDEAEIWNIGNLWLVQVEHCSHNNLAEYVIVDDAIAQWSKQL